MEGVQTEGWNGGGKRGVNGGRRGVETGSARKTYINDLLDIRPLAAKQLQKHTRVWYTHTYTGVGNTQVWNTYRYGTCTGK